MLKIQSDKIIIDGHEPTREQCETMTLLANRMNSKDAYIKNSNKEGKNGSN